MSPLRWATVVVNIFPDTIVPLDSSLELQMDQVGYHSPVFLLAISDLCDL